MLTSGRRHSLKDVFVRGGEFMKKQKNWFIRHKIITVVLIVIVLIIWSIVSSSSAKNSFQQGAEAGQQGAPGGIQVNRAAFIQTLQKAAAVGGTTIDFKQGDQLNGQDNYVAQQGQNIIQLIGPADNLTEIEGEATVDTQAQNYMDNITSLIYVVGVANVIDPQAKDWVTHTIDNEMKSGKSTVSEDKVIDGRDYTVELKAANNSTTFIVLTVKAAQ
jgi:hypothetical protein